MPPKGLSGQGGGRRSDRDLKVRVKTSKGRKIGSTLWLQRQLNDPYVARARAEGYRSRAAFKIMELDERYHLFKKGQRVVDLGIAPGGWSQVAAPIVGSTSEKPLIVGIDYLDMDPIEGVIILKKDFNDEDAPQAIIDAMGGHQVDVVLSDMAAPTTGHRATDHIRIMQLVELAADFAVRVLAPGGTFVTKVFQGGTEHELLGMLKRHFDTTIHAKPKASRVESAETYLLARGFKGKAPPDRE
jgi:23S rRNA (uridine2552-2'-O)-methyltransferase